MGYAVSKFGDTWRYVAMGRAARRDAAKSARHHRAIRGARSVASREITIRPTFGHSFASERKTSQFAHGTCFRFRRFVRLSRDHTLPWPPPLRLPRWHSLVFGDTPICGDGWRWVGMRRNGRGPSQSAAWRGGNGACGTRARAAPKTAICQYVAIRGDAWRCVALGGVAERCVAHIPLVPLEPRGLPPLSPISK